jgi:site-specific DNA recombinase
MRAVGYIRVSTEDQAREGVSLDNQKAKIKAYCDLKDLELVDVIEDAGISAKNLNRPGIKKVLELSKTKQIDAVVTYKLDRMFRSTVDALESTKKFDKWGVSFHSLQENLDTKSAMGKFFFTLIAALAEMERGIVSERTKAALSHKRSKNEKTGGDIPFGYNLTENGLLVANEAEQKAISLMVELRNKGYSLRAIAAELEKEGYRTRRGKAKWHHQTISQIIKIESKRVKALRLAA